MHVDEPRRDHQPRNVYNLGGGSITSRCQKSDPPSSHAINHPHIPPHQRSPGPVSHQPPTQHQRQTTHRRLAGSTPLRATTSSMLSAARSTWNRTTSPSDTSNPNTGGIGRLLYWNGEEK